VRAVVQRVSTAKVAIDGEVSGAIGCGLLVLLGIGSLDTEADADYLIDKITGLRIFDDSEGKMNLSLDQAKGSLLIVSQFTLYGDTRGGRRPSFIGAAKGDTARRLYEYFVANAQERTGSVQTGIFGAMMAVELVNDGPVTILLDSEKTI